MKKFSILIILIFSVQVVAQKKFKRANNLFEELRYKEAALIYQSAAKKGDNSFEVLSKAGDANYFNTDMKNANYWYDQLISLYLDEVDPEYIFRYAHSLQGVGDYKAAKKWMKIFAKRSQLNDKRIDEFEQSEKSLNDILDILPTFELNTLKINTPYSDFGPAYYRNKLIYSSAIDTSYFIKRRYNWNNQPYLNFYLGQINAAGNQVSKEKEFSQAINTRFHEATLTFTKDYKRVFFTRNNYDQDLKRDELGVSHLKLYTATRNDSIGDWENIIELPFNSDNYSTGHPTLSHDEKQLYFVSDMPGTIGATDIFVVNILGDNEYSIPKNVGPTINTSGREMFPFVTESKLYFASDGHLGLGGLDVFESDFENNKFNEPINLGTPLNSKLDDFGFIIDQDNEQGFVCSNREGGVGDDDIYAFRRLEVQQDSLPQENCDQIVKGYVTNSRTGERISDVILALYNEEGVKITQTQSKVNGDYVFNVALDCNNSYEIKIEKLGYDPNTKSFVTSSISEETIVPLELATIDELIVEEQGQLKIKVGIIFFDLDKTYIRPDAAIELNKIVTLMSQQPDIVIRIESHTDSRADDNYNLDLSQRRAYSTKEYLLNQGIDATRIIGVQGFGENQLLNNCTNGIPCEEAQHQLNRRSEFIIVKM